MSISIFVCYFRNWKDLCHQYGQFGMRHQIVGMVPLKPETEFPQTRDMQRHFILHGIGIGGPGYSIKGEFSMNGVSNSLRHTRGVISMARSGHPDSAGSQFFIMVEDAPHLDGQYAAFGKVVEGLDAADQIVSARRDRSDKPLEDQVMESVTVETFGIDYGEPEKTRTR